MMTRIPFPVIATRDNTVTFWPAGADSAFVTLSYLTKNDVREA